MNFDDYVEMFLYFNTILPPAAVRLNRVTILGLTPSPGCRAVQSHGFVSIIATRYNRAVNDNYNGMPETAQAKAMTRAAIDGNLTELNLGGIRQTASELALHSLAQGFKPNDDYEKMLFYYHPDHLGSSSYITNLDGEVSQHIEYVPFGEVFIDELELTRKSAAAVKANCNNTWNTPYRFNDCANEGRGKLGCSMPSAANRRVELNAKEFDEETGMYYYGARYYEPRISLWMSTDPMQEKYPMSTTYCFVNNNPIKEIDPDGCDGYVIINGNKITITANVYLYGAGATKSVADQMQKDVNGKWSSSTFSAKSANGTSFRVSVKVKILLYNNKEKSDPFIIPQSWNPYNRDNFVEVGANDKRSYVTGGDEGLWRSQGRNGRTLAEDDPAPHEIGHILGLTDRYKDKNGASVTDIGWENNIMGNSRTGKVEQRNIDGILKDSMKAYNNWIKNPKNKGKEFRYEIDKDTPDK